MGSKRNILVVSAHHDDLEVACGGAVARFVAEGHTVTSLVMTHSGYQDQHGREVRRRADALAEGRAAAAVLGYDLISLDEDTFDIPVADRSTARIIDIVQTRKIDTVFTHWAGDTHPAHARVHTMALQACRRVPRLFVFAANWYIGDLPFHPTTFVSLEEDHWQKKLEALACYKSEYARAGQVWVEYLDHGTRNYGVQLGVERAEGFGTLKNLMDL